MPSDQTRRLPHVVIIGGGFGGMLAAQALNKTPTQVTLIDRRNFHLFQPLLYQVATGALSPALADLLALRVRMGGGALARVLARLADPFGGGALQLLPVENRNERSTLQSLLCDVGNSALLFETRDGEPVVDAQCRPGSGRPSGVQDSSTTTPSSHADH